MKNLNKLASAALVSLAATSAAFAAPAGDYDAIVDSVDFSEVVTGIGAIAALIAGVLVVRKGVRMLLGFIR